MKTHWLLLVLLLSPAIARAEAPLRPPINLNELHVWRDGGSLGFKLSDADQHHISFCVDGKIGSPTAGYFFLGVTHATQNGAQKLDLGCDTEKKLVSYLEAWLATNFKPEQLLGISSTQNVGNLKQNEFKAWHVLRLVENRVKARRNAHSPSTITLRPPSVPLVACDIWSPADQLTATNTTHWTASRTDSQVSSLLTASSFASWGQGRPVSLHWSRRV